MAEIKQTWRKHEGKFIHDGDCHFWGDHICTCGLIHRLMPMFNGEKEMYHGDYYHDLALQDNALRHLHFNPPPPLPKLTDAEIAENMRILEETFTTEANGRRE
jgi:hypothetical protein